MIPAYNKKRCASFPFETGIHFRRKTDFFLEEDNTTKSYSGFEPEPTRLQTEGHSHHTGWATIMLTASVRRESDFRKPFCDSASASEKKSVLLKDQTGSIVLTARVSEGKRFSEAVLQSKFSFGEGERPLLIEDQTDLHLQC
ncbi:hypothetical protein TNCV_1319861 [Trichonephila clavipes]|nr:hypothetical protein TNCV_1319861 [Trichonephila clavipes]